MSCQSKKPWLCLIAWPLLKCLITGIRSRPSLRYKMVNVQCSSSFLLILQFIFPLSKGSLAHLGQDPAGLCSATLAQWLAILGDPSSPSSPGEPKDEGQALALQRRPHLPCEGSLGQHRPANTNKSDLLPSCPGATGTTRAIGNLGKEKLKQARHQGLR